MKIYIASFFDTRERLRPVRDALWKMGHEVVSSWLDEVARPAGMSDDAFYRKLAMKDVAEVKSADLLIVDTFDPPTRGGRENEYGIALGQFQSKLLFVVGPYRTIFHRLADAQFDSWEACLEHLRELATVPTIRDGAIA